MDGEEVVKWAVVRAVVRVAAAWEGVGVGGEREVVRVAAAWGVVLVEEGTVLAEEGTVLVGGVGEEREVAVGEAVGEKGKVLVGGVVEEREVREVRGEVAW